MRYHFVLFEALFSSNRVSLSWLRLPESGLAGCRCELDQSDGVPGATRALPVADSQC